jgi:hypothetical protein
MAWGRPHLRSYRLFFRSSLAVCVAGFGLAYFAILDQLKIGDLFDCILYVSNFAAGVTAGMWVARRQLLPTTKSD